MPLAELCAPDPVRELADNLSFGSAEQFQSYTPALGVLVLFYAINSKSDQAVLEKAVGMFFL